VSGRVGGDQRHCPAAAYAAALRSNFHRLRDVRMRLETPPFV
jgi:hypothetical protein